MSQQQLLLDRIEFSTIKVDTVADSEVKHEEAFPQIRFDFNNVMFLVRSELSYPSEEVRDPRHFALTYAVKLDTKSQEKGLKLPYEVEVEATAYLRYEGGEDYTGVDRFRAVRHSGYQILYGAMREMICNLTARGRHGMWQLPARRFDAVAKDRAEQDEKSRQELLLGKAASRKAAGVAVKQRRGKTPNRKTRSKKEADSASE
jgi:preprotein translocase subunit SecB